MKSLQSLCYFKTKVLKQKHGLAIEMYDGFDIYISWGIIVPMC